MWDAWLNLKTYHRRASDDLEVTDSIAAWCVDGAVMWYGITIENALQERVNEGTQKQPRYEPRYTLSQLLDSDFRLPRPAVTRDGQASKPANEQQKGFQTLLAMAQKPRSGVVLWRTVD